MRNLPVIDLIVIAAYLLAMVLVGVYFSRKSKGSEQFTKAGGLIPGYAKHKSQMSVADYVDRVVGGELTDPTLSFQLRTGFRVRGLIENYIEDSASDNWSTLIVWQNPDYHE